MSPRPAGSLERSLERKAEGPGIGPNYTSFHIQIIVNQRAHVQSPASPGDSSSSILRDPQGCFPNLGISLLDVTHCRLPAETDLSVTLKA